MNAAGDFASPAPRHAVAEGGRPRRLRTEDSFAIGAGIAHAMRRKDAEASQFKAPHRTPNHASRQQSAVTLRVAFRPP